MNRNLSRLISVALAVTLLVTSFASAPFAFADEKDDGQVVINEMAESEAAEDDMIEPEAVEDEIADETAEENEADSELTLTAEPEDNSESETVPESEPEEQVQVDAPGNDELPVLKIKAETVKKPYKNTNGKFVVLFTAEWDDYAKIKDLKNNGWAVSYTLRDQNNKILAKNVYIKKGIKFSVNKITKYKIRARFTKKGKKNKIYETKYIGKIKFPAKPEGLKAKCPKSSNNVKLKWKAVDNAFAYYIYRSSNKKTPSKPIARVKKTSYKDKNVKGGTYRYYVQAVYRHTKGFKYQSASKLSSRAQVKVNKYLTKAVRTIIWFTTISGGAATLYDKATGSASHGKLKNGTRVEVLKKYPKKIPRGGKATRIYVTYKKGKTVKKGWIQFSKHVKGRVHAKVAYKHGKAYDWTKERKEEYVNKKGYKSKTKYLIWVSVYTQRANIFKGKKGHWKLVHSFRVVSGEFLWWTKLGENYRIWKRSPKRVRYFVGSTTRKYWYQYLSHFQGGNAFHTVCWLYPNKTKQVNFIKENLQPGTKGCMRMYTPDAIWIYNNVPLETRVVIY